jgi:hypothetical protein
LNGSKSALLAVALWAAAGLTGAAPRFDAAMADRARAKAGNKAGMILDTGAPSFLDVMKVQRRSIEYSGRRA